VTLSHISVHAERLAHYKKIRSKQYKKAVKDSPSTVSQYEKKAASERS
jgi:hypothetical protein